MKKILIVLMTLSFSAQAEDWSLSGKLSTLGMSMEIGRPISGNLSGRLSANLFSYDDTITESGIDYDVSLDLKSAGLLLDWHPGNTSFRLTVGGYVNGNSAGLDAKAISGTFNINGTNYIATDVGSLTGSVDYKSTAPYLGIGWGNIGHGGKGWGMSWDLGVLYQGSPVVGLDVTCAPSLSPAQCTTLTNDVNAESQALRTEIENNKWYPVFSLGVLYRF